MKKTMVMSKAMSFDEMQVVNGGIDVAQASYTGSDVSLVQSDGMNAELATSLICTAAIGAGVSIGLAASGVTLGIGAALGATVCAAVVSYGCSKAFTPMFQ